MPRCQHCQRPVEYRFSAWSHVDEFVEPGHSAEPRSTRYLLTRCQNDGCTRLAMMPPADLENGPSPADEFAIVWCDECHQATDALFIDPQTGQPEGVGVCDLCGEHEMHDHDPEEYGVFEGNPRDPDTLSERERDHEQDRYRTEFFR